MITTQQPSFTTTTPPPLSLSSPTILSKFSSNGFLNKTFSTFYLSFSETLLNGTRFFIPPIVIITNRKSKVGESYVGSALPNELHFEKLPSHLEGKLCFLGIFEVTFEAQRQRFEPSHHLWYNEEEIPSGIVSKGGSLTLLGVSNVNKKLSSQLTKPNFVLVLFCESSAIMLSELFFVKCRWGSSTDETEKILERAQKLGRPILNKNLIEDIEKIKDKWRSSPDLTKKVSSASWLQVRLLADCREPSSISLEDRVDAYCANSKAYKEFARELQEHLSQLHKTQIKLAPLLSGNLLSSFPSSSNKPEITSMFSPPIVVANPKAKRKRPASKNEEKPSKKKKQKKTQVAEKVLPPDSPELKPLDLDPSVLSLKTSEKSSRDLSFLYDFEFSPETISNVNSFLQSLDCKTQASLLEDPNEGQPSITSEAMEESFFDLFSQSNLEALISKNEGSFFDSNFDDLSNLPPFPQL